MPRRLARPPQRAHTGGRGIVTIGLEGSPDGLGIGPIVLRQQLQERQPRRVVHAPAGRNQLAGKGRTGCLSPRRQQIAAEFGHGGPTSAGPPAAYQIAAGIRDRQPELVEHARAHPQVPLTPLRLS